MSLPQPEPAEVEAAIADLLREQELGVLATLRADGFPSASTMYIAADVLTVYCHTFGYTRKYQDIRHDPRVSYTLSHLPANGYDGRQELRMVQVSGRAAFLTEPAETEHALRVCGQQFQWLDDRKRRAAFERDAREGRLTFFRIDPEQALWNDNRVRPAWRVLVSFTRDGRHVTELTPYGPQPE
jgi:nitroimidazol reductase NimA-like FMN-containing flavoprotein (pyridoxamine 5'-phosphate oxidase superfamily)